MREQMSRNIWDFRETATDHHDDHENRNKNEWFLWDILLPGDLSMNQKSSNQVTKTNPQKQ